MKEQIFVLNEKGALIELNESEFITEDQFQKLLENYPKLISGNQINPDNPRRWLFIAREFGVPDNETGNNKWHLDHLFIDQDGIPTLVEVKRKSDSRIRREVVGQMLDYAANAVTYWSVDEIRSKFEKYCEVKGLEPVMLLQDLLGEGKDIDNFWETVDLNLKTGKIRMLFIADKIPKELQQIIEFLNEQMSPAEVLGIELRQFGNKTIKTLVPRVVGQTFSTREKKGIREGKQWTKETFLDELERKNSKLEREVVEKLIKHFEDKVSRFWYGKGQQYGSLIPTIYVRNISHWPFAIWTYGRIELYFQWYKGRQPFDNIEKRKELLRRLNEIKGINIPESKIEKRPAFDIKILKEKSEFEKFIRVFDWYIEEVKKYGK